MDSLLKFYLDTVLPTAMNNRTQNNNDFKSPIDSIGNIFHELKKEIVQCVSRLALYSPI
jgi:hypothetical protein